MWVVATIAVRNLVQAPRRTGLLTAAIGLVTLLLVTLLSLAAGIEDNMVRAATALSGGHVTVAGFYKGTPTDASPIVTDAAKMRDILVAETPGLDYLIQRHRGWGKVVSDMGSYNTGLAGLNIAEEERFLKVLRLAEEAEYVDGGRNEVLGDARGLAKRGTMMVFAAAAKRLGIRVGDRVTVQTETRGGHTNTMDLTVVAVARDLGMISGWTAFMHRDDVLEIYRLNTDTTGAFWLFLDDIDAAPEVMQHLRGVLAGHGYTVMDHEPNPFFFKFDRVSGEDWTGQQIDLTLWKDEVSFLMWVITAFNTVTWFLVLVLLAIIAVGIMNALWSSVRERTREIGTLRAIGMGRVRVLMMILVEALLLGLFATTLGAVSAVVLAMSLNAAAIEISIDAVRVILLSDTLHLVVHPSTLVAAVLALTTFTGFAGLFPAARAARMRPITAIHHVE
jgi:putative ABC transport system permease protein